VHFWGLPPTGARTPHLTHVSYSSGDPEKNGFCLGGIGPHLGEIWGFEIWLLANFGLLLLGTLSSDFRLFDCVRQLQGCSNDPENFVKIKFVEFEQCALEFGKNALRTLNIFAKSGGRYNGVMVTAPGDSSVTVRDRPIMYWGSNRKSGSLSRKNGSSPYFYFRFGRHSPLDDGFYGISAHAAALSPVMVGRSVQAPKSVRSILLPVR